MKKTILEVLSLSGITMAVGTTLLFCFTWILAYMSPDKSVLVMVNSAGEAKVELVMLIITIPLCLFSLIRYIRKLMLGKEK